MNKNRTIVIRTNAIRTNAIRANTIRTNTIRTNAIRTNAIRTNAIRTNGIRTNATRLCHPPDGSTSPEDKLLCFITTKIFFSKEKNALAFNWDRCSHLVICLWLIPFH